MKALVWLNQASIDSFVSTVFRERIVAAGAEGKWLCVGNILRKAVKLINLNPVLTCL